MDDDPHAAVPWSVELGPGVGFQDDESAWGLSLAGRARVTPWLSAGADLRRSWEVTSYANEELTLAAMGELGPAGGLHGPYVGGGLGVGRLSPSGWYYTYMAKPPVVPVATLELGVRSLWRSGFVLRDAVAVDYRSVDSRHYAGGQLRLNVSVGWSPSPPGGELPRGWTGSGWVATILAPVGSLVGLGGLFFTVMNAIQ